MKKTVASLLSLWALVAVGGDVPSESIYNLHVRLTNQSGVQHDLDVYRGQPVLIALFYASCPAVCPLLIDSVRGVENALDAKQKSQLRVLFISIDSEKDTPQALLELARVRKLETGRWTLARADASDVRKIAALLNVQYRKLPNGEFNHSSVITLLDRNGAKVMHTSTLDKVDPVLLSAVRSERPSGH